MKRSAVLLGICLAGCTSQHFGQTVSKEPLMLPKEESIAAVQKQTAERSIAPVPAQCPDGRPILSGWATNSHTASPDDRTSYIPGDADMKELYAGRRYNAKIIRRLANQIRTRNQIIKAILSAARSGNWCGGPK